MAEQACAALCALCYGTDAGVEGRCARAADAGALEAVVVAMRAHEGSEGVQGNGCGAAAW